MVDFAVSLRPDDLLQRKIDTLLTKTDSTTINHTAYAPLRSSPIAISIETKTPDGSESQTRAQLAVWGAAHLFRLDRLRALLPECKRPALPTLPLVLVSGVSWHLYFITLRGGKVMMVGSHALGGTQTLLGAYKLLHAIQALAEWTKALTNWWEALMKLI